MNTKPNIELPNTRPSYTRFNPTTNGELHVGHLYMIYVNEAEAHENGGKFCVRFDDNQEVYDYGVSWTGERMTPEQIDDTKNRMVEDILWSGVQVDGWSSQRENQRRVREFLRHLNGGEDLKVRKCYTSQINPEIHWLDWEAGYPYVPHLTAEKVLYDYLDGCNLIIRGEDLLDEWALYYYFADLWGLPPSRQVFLKRLELESGEQMLDISKRKGGWKIRGYREQGWSPDKLRMMLAETCLIDPEKPWLVSNCRIQPIWKF